MPILDVELVLEPGEALRPELAGELADQAGEVFGAAPGTTWVKLRRFLPNTTPKIKPPIPRCLPCIRVRHESEAAAIR